MWNVVVKSGIVVAVGIFFWCSLQGRHPFRRHNPQFPIITAHFETSSKKYTLHSPYVRLYPLFAFNTDYLHEYLLPQSQIRYRDNNGSVTGAALDSIIEETVKEIKKKKRKVRKSKQLKQFKILQDKNFNYKQTCGLIVLKFKDHPFVLKLFIEQPRTILNCRATGMEPTFFFYMGGGSNRHLSGFTRIKNREIMIQKIKKFPEWRSHVKFPRKWFWLPHGSKEIVLTGYNLGGHDMIQTRIPSIYGIVADEIDLNKETDRILPKTKSKIVMNLCNDLELFVDPHAKNFTFIEDKKHKKFDIIIVDTEHFPTMVGIQKARTFRSHSGWYSYLVRKCFTDMYLQSKRDLLAAQTRISELSIM